MPTYRISAPRERLSPERKRAVAEAVTACHHRITFAPRYYVQVIFEPLADDDQYIAGRLQTASQIFIAGTIREGRTAAQKEALLQDMIDGVSAALEMPRRQVWCYLYELSAEQMAEFGERLPPAGSEDAWFARLSGDQQRYMTDMDRA